MNIITLTADQATAAAEMIALLTKQELAFTSELRDGCWIITVTGY